MLRIHQIAKRKGVSLSLINKLATLPAFPPVERKVNGFTFYNLGAIDFYWSNRKDGRRKRRGE